MNVVPSLYLPPIVETIEICIERGYAASLATGDGHIGDIEDGGSFQQ